ncbi:MAG: hypothetical protein EXR72_07665 [Myxococcales bacterium]|nr:hypothetical protein [Myxococcales bacterium]
MLGLRRIALLGALLLAACGDPPKPADDLAASADLAMACTTDTSCGGATPYCDAKSGQCVACMKEEHCPDGKLCNGGQCAIGCSALKGCGDGGTCDVDAGVCKSCGADPDCSGATPRCDLATARCVACLPEKDDCPMGKSCSKVNGVYTCVQGCKVDDECKADGGALTAACCDHLCVNTAADNAHCGKCASPCDVAKTCCAAACFDPMTDLDHCGGCGLACKPANGTGACMAGLCALTACAMGFNDCNKSLADGCEVNLGTDTKNCGMCGMVCATANGTPGCNGTCTVAACAMGFADCDKDPQNGCEVDLTSTLAHCGMCGAACAAVAHGTPACKAGQCAVAACDGTFKDCDGSLANGCELDTASDVKGCGLCGKSCPAVANGTAACAVGVCAVGACNGAFRDCNTNLGDGCEINSASDLKHCGLCGNACAAIANGTVACTASACAVGACTAPFKDCNASVVDGCETNLTSDVKHCAACNTPCAAIANGTPGCAASKCGVGKCNGTFADCNLGPVDGCEADTATDAKNCGVCGKVCPFAQPCVSGLCQLPVNGTGSSGQLIVNFGTTIINTVASAAAGVTGSTALSLSLPAGFAAGQIVLLHQSQGQGVGAWELNYISALAGNNATLLRPLQNDYLIGGKDRAQAVMVPQHSNLSVAVNSTITAPPWSGNTGGILVFLASGTVKLDGAISMAGRGYRGPLKPGMIKFPGGQGEGTPGIGAVSINANGTGGGGGGRDQCECCFAGSGGGGAHAQGGVVGQVGGGCEPAGKAGGPAVGDTQLATLFFGGAGGAGASDDTGTGGDGANGGGIIYIATPSLTLNASGSINASGDKGGLETNGSGCGSGGGGGGAGGAVFLRATAGSLGNSQVSAQGGIGGDDPNNCGVGGGAGSTGRIHLAGGIVGTTNPPAQ